MIGWNENDSRKCSECSENGIEESYQEWSEKSVTDHQSGHPCYYSKVEEDVRITNSVVRGEEVGVTTEVIGRETHRKDQTHHTQQHHWKGGEGMYVQSVEQYRRNSTFTTICDRMRKGPI